MSQKRKIMIAVLLLLSAAVTIQPAGQFWEACYTQINQHLKTPELSYRIIHALS